VTDIAEDSIFDAVAGYNQAARYYDDWEWQEYWSKNELPWVVERVKSQAAVKKILDLGCGTGRLLEQLAGGPYHLAGLDSSEEMLRIARQRLASKAELQLGSVASIPWPDQSFDLVTACRVLSHVADCEPVLAQAYRVTTSVGLLLITDIHPSHDYKTGHTRVYGDWGQVAIRTYRHQPQEILTTAREIGWKCLENLTITAQSSQWLPGSLQLKSLDRQGAKPLSFRLLLGK
jgi:ubiquinone/menaquinone biosynthesis C-methylase UbiE